jgi:ATP-dependent Zn protease
MKKMTIATIALLLITSTIFSQTTKKLIDTASLKYQFDNIINTSNDFKGYKVIKATSLLKLQANVLDSLSVSKEKILANADFRDSQKRIIDSLQSKSTASKAVVSNLRSEKESISLFGIQFEKTFFKTLFFLIVLGLIAILLFFIFKFKQSNAITVESKLALEQSEKEFEIYKEKALEREQKAMRKLQDELNKRKKEFSATLPRA